jgi:predicted hydrocarbon binding protein
MENLLIKPGEYLLDRNNFIMGKEPMIFHCHHYNIFLQQSIEDTKEYIDVYPILKDSGQEVAYSQFSEIFTPEDSITDRLRMVESHYQFCGFGKIDLSDISEGLGVVETAHEHYAVGWNLKNDLRKADEPGVAFFTCGFLAGAMEAVYDIPLGTLETTQTQCLSKGDDVCSFDIHQRAQPVELSQSPKEGKYQTFKGYPQPENTGVNYAGIRDALINMEIAGSEDDGLINAFGVVLTRHFANYYALISLRTMFSMEVAFGEQGVQIVQDLLVEAGHVCAFNTLGGIMLSPEWESMILPMIESKDDWTHGIVACANAMGWGLWSVGDIKPEDQTMFRITSGYESNAFLKMYEDETKYPACCFIDGAISGIMNLIYHGDIASRPELTEEYYIEIFKSEGRFNTKQVKARTMGADHDYFSVGR